MKTQTTKKRTTATRQQATVKATATKKQAQPVKSNEAYTDIPLNKIAFSPLNYRKYFSPKVLDDFAQEISVHGIISPVTVRPSGKDSYELVAGERRVRAAALAGLKVVPAVIKTLSDDEVREIQLAENIQRENPHPLHEAQAINDMLKSGKSIADTAGRLGKSKSFVYSRMKLTDLTEDFQTVFLADKITIQQAFEIAKLPEDAQQELFNNYFDDWEDAQFRIGDLDDILDEFRYDLTKAPFNTKDKKLVADAGACSGCPFNSATLKTLFPELANHAVCSNIACYHAKCNAHFSKEVKNAFEENAPDVIITHNGALPTVVKEYAEQNGAAELPVYTRYDVGILSAPEAPDKEDYCYSDNDEEEENSEGETAFDESGYNEALAEYEEAKQEYENRIASGDLKKGLYFNNNRVETVYCTTDRQSYGENKTSVTAKEVQEAIKAGKATPELLQSEIERLNAREERAKELDSEKLQEKVHGQFAALCADAENTNGLTRADMAAARLLVFQQLNFSARQRVSDFLFSTEMKEATDNNLFEMLAGITDIQFSYLIRMAVIGKAESKSPRDIIGYSLCKMAEQAGVNITAIEEEQAEKISDREERLTARIKDLEKKISKLNKALEMTQALAQAV